MFNQIYIDRTNADGSVASTLRVPIAYGPRDKAIARVTGNPDLDKKFSSYLPFMTFEMPSMRYNGSRHLETIRREKGRTDNKDLAAWVFTPVPYDFTFVLTISVKFADDGTKIIEQIAPYFTPSWTATLKLIDEPIIIKDITVTLKDHTIVDSWQGSYDENRTITHTLTFDMQGFLFGPSEKSKIIKVAKTQVGNQDSFSASVTVQPGLTVDGKPTEDINETVPYSEISWDDDFGFITQKDII